MVWYAHLFQNFPQFIVIHTAKGFGIVNKAEVDVFLELYFFNDSIKSDEISRSVLCDSLRPHESQHTRPPCPSPTPGVHSDSCPSSQ